ncbi:MAG: hypothetical protein RBR28_02170 [Lentimicrobium sp.]|jgi:hypothetical protein|nr:hypothetical protein [Lentimicrobium sp.]
MKSYFTQLLLSKKAAMSSLLMAGFTLFCLSQTASAENIITAGTTLRVTAGTTLVSVENILIKSGATLNNSGTVIARKNVVNQNVAANSLGSGTLQMSGTVQQTISGSNIIQNLVINNAAGIVNGGQTRVDGVLTMTNGRITLGSNHLTLGAAASIAGVPSASAMVVATGSGELRKSFSSAGSFTFIVGDNTGTAEYTPVTLTFSGGTYGGSNYAGVNLINSAYPGASGSYINRYWMVTQSGISGFTCNATFQYTVADVTGVESSILCVRVLPEPPVTYSPANTVLHQLTANALTAFGTFTGRMPFTDKTLNLTLFLEGLYNGGSTMRKAQNAGGPQFPGSTADQIQVELRNAANYSNIIYTAGNVNLSTTGLASATIPAAFGGSYYLTIKHRNSIATVSALPVSLSAATTNYSFNAPSKAYGGNLLMMIDGVYAIFGGDVNQDGAVDISDMTPIDNDASNFLNGYLTTDINGDASVDISDMTIVDNNASSFVSSITP